MYLYYCPKCGYERFISDIPSDSRINNRDTWGMPIYHSNCPNCGNTNAGCMVVCNKQEHVVDNLELDYIRYVIGLYQHQC